MTSAAFDARLAALSPALLKGLKRGIEKESLRVRPDGALALTPHPRALGSALKHPHITTDFSEALIELITGVQTCALPISALSPAVLKGLKRGIEKESLRVRPDGALALTPHPRDRKSVV